MEIFVIGRKLRSFPTRVMSVPWSVVINGNRRGAAMDGPAARLPNGGWRNGHAAGRGFPFPPPASFSRRAKGRREHGRTGDSLRSPPRGTESVVGFGEADGRCVTDEMDLMAASSQFHPQFRGDHTRASVRWVARDPNLHVYSNAWLVSSSEIYLRESQFMMPGELRV